MRVALLGAGRIGIMHARLLAATRSIERLVIADAIPGRADIAARDLGANAVAVATPEAAFDQVDAVVIAAATDAHADLIREAMSRGLPTFCEKPLAHDLATTLALADEIERSGVPFQLGFQRRFDPAYLEARRLVRTGALGTLYVIRLAGHDPVPPHDAYIPVSGGLFRDFSIHDFDILRWMTSDEVEQVYADGSVLGFPIFAKYGDVDTATAMLRMRAGTQVILSATRHDPLGYDIRAELFGSLDSVTVGLGPRTPIRSLEPGVAPMAGPAWPDFIDRFDAAYAAELTTFVRVAAGELPSPCTARDGVEALRIAEAATRSLHERRAVSLADIPSGPEGLPDREKEVVAPK
ncbi:MAG: Gfo/Idh/MocA family oxidoreductase [Candidatus Limnocylindrales bacterium]